MTRHSESSGPERALTLVVGADTVGKTTLLSNIARDIPGTVVVEPTNSPEARAFKEQHRKSEIDESFIAEREQLFLQINAEFDGTISELHDAGYNVATSGSALVTLVSHSLMRDFIGRPDKHIDQVVGEWIESDMRKPDELVWLHASDKAVSRRLSDRGLRGLGREPATGFNDPEFLSRYQKALGRTLDIVARDSDISTLAIDSSKGTADATAQYYREHSRRSDS